jgi:hypothetical protein
MEYAEYAPPTLLMHVRHHGCTAWHVWGKGVAVAQRANAISKSIYHFFLYYFKSNEK